MLIVAVCGLVYANSLGGSFHYDDEHSVQNNINIRDFSRKNLARFFVDPAMFSVDADKGMYRPVLLVTYALNFALDRALAEGSGREQPGGFGVHGYHLVNLLIHAANACLVWWLAGLLGGGRAARLLAGLLFAAHPICTEPVNYISSRSESLASLFYLLGMAAFIRARGRGRIMWVSWGALALGLLSKSTVITLPLVLLLYDYLYLSGRSWRRLYSRAWPCHLPGRGISLAYVVVIIANGFLGRSAGNPVRSAWPQILTQVKAIGFYVHLLAAPIHLSVEQQFEVQEKASHPVVVAAFLLVLSLGFLAVLAWRWRQRLVVFLLGWGVTVLLPVLVFPLNVLVNERRLYLSCAALCIGLAQAFPLNRWQRGQAGGWQWAPVALLIAWFGALSFQHNRVWADDFSLWRSAAVESPMMPRVHLYLGNAHKEVALRAKTKEVERAHWDSAIVAYRRVIELDRDPELSLRAANNVGAVHFMLKDYGPAEEAFRRAVDINPEYADAIINLASAVRERVITMADPIKRRQGLGECLHLYQRAMAVRPNHYQAHGNIGVVYQDLGQHGEARQSYERAVLLNPRDYNTLKNLGNLYVTLAGIAGDQGESGEAELRRARQYYLLSLREYPGFPHAREGLRKVDGLLTKALDQE